MTIIWLLKVILTSITALAHHTIVLPTVQTTNVLDKAAVAEEIPRRNLSQTVAINVNTHRAFIAENHFVCNHLLHAFNFNKNFKNISAQA